ncbi:MAG: hypothetical protein LDL41_08155 [Coleofasciculus sp. S288]|nr:hypothetical protein [Coleofasciculus sp. S288]
MLETSTFTWQVVGATAELATLSDRCLQQRIPQYKKLGRLLGDRVALSRLFRAGL